VHTGKGVWTCCHACCTSAHAWQRTLEPCLGCAFEFTSMGQRECAGRADAHHWCAPLLCMFCSTSPPLLQYVSICFPPGGVSLEPVDCPWDPSANVSANGGYAGGAECNGTLYLPPAAMASFAVEGWGYIRCCELASSCWCLPGGCTLLASRDAPAGDKGWRDGRWAAANCPLALSFAARVCRFTPSLQLRTLCHAIHHTVCSDLALHALLLPVPSRYLLPFALLQPPDSCVSEFPYILPGAISGTVCGFKWQHHALLHSVCASSINRSQPQPCLF